MNAAQRRERILTRLTGASEPMSASLLAGELGVSRQIVVGDVALLRAAGAQIDATPRGYQLHPAAKGSKLCCCHTLFAVSLLHGADDDMTAIDGRRAEQIHIAAVCQLEFPAQLDSGQREVAHCDIRPVDAR